MSDFPHKFLTNTRFLATLSLLLIVGLETRIEASLEELRPGMRIKDLQVRVNN